MKPLLYLPIAVLLAACGADGDPVRPDVSTAIGINSDGDVSTWTSISASSGNVSVSVGL